MTSRDGTQAVLPLRTLGETGIEVPCFGLGADKLGRPDVSEEQAQAVLEAAFDAGVRFIDTSIGYAFSEERIGRFLKRHSEKMVICSKVGYRVKPIPEDVGNCPVGK